MEIFLDTGSVKEVQDAVEYGVVDGVTTNPTLIAKEGKDFHTVIRKISKLVKVVNAEVVSVEAKGMLKEVTKLKTLGRNVVIKIPMIPEGIKAVSALSKKKVKTNVTLCFSANQALLAAKAGATYVSPFVGRLDDTGWDGLQLIADIREIYDNYGFKTKILFASTRSPWHVKEAALAGADVCTMPYSVFEKMFKHPLTDIGLAKFLSDWKKRKK